MIGVKHQEFRGFLKGGNYEVNHGRLASGEMQSQKVRLFLGERNFVGFVD